MRVVRDAICSLTGVILHPPKQLVFEATNHCNRNCFFCGAAQLVGKCAKGYMGWPLFLSLVDQAAGIRPELISLHAHGEPLLHPRIVDMVREISSRGLASEIATNGDLLTEQLSADLRDAGLSRLVISHPAVSPENWQECRNELYDPQMEKRLEAAISIWNTSGREVVVRCLVLPESLKKKAGDVRAFLSRWLPVEAVTEMEFWLYQPWPEHVLEERLRMLFARPKICTHALETLTVAWNGAVTPCPYDVTGELVLGDAQDDPLEKIWRFGGMRQFRRKTIRCSKARPLLCRKCLVNRSVAETVSVIGEEYRRLEPGKRESWMRETGTRCYLGLLGRSQGADRGVSKKREKRLKQ